MSARVLGLAIQWVDLRPLGQIGLADFRVVPLLDLDLLVVALEMHRRNSFY